jgi:hypothetical protein
VQVLLGSSGVIAASLLSIGRDANILILVMVSMLRLEFLHCHSGLDRWRCCFQMHIEGDVLGWI